MGFINKVGLVKSKRNSQKEFDNEISEKLIIRDKLFKKLKKKQGFLQIRIFTKEHDLLHKISFQKKGYFEKKLGICKPKDQWKALKSFGLPNKSGECQFLLFIYNL